MFYSYLIIMFHTVYYKTLCPQCYFAPITHLVNIYTEFKKENLELSRK